jgi:uncharacterized membrane protein
MVFFLVVDFLVVLVVFAAALLLGKHLFKRFFSTYQDKKPGRRRQIEFLWCATIAVSASMSFLIFFEIFDIMNLESRWINWRFNIMFMLLLTVFVNPWYIVTFAVEKFVSTTEGT